MNWQRIGTVGLAVLSIATASIDARPTKKGQRFSQTELPITCDQEGQPIVGGKHPLKTMDTPKGTLLVVIDAVGQQQYLAFDAAGKSVRVTALEKPDENCYWKVVIEERGKVGPRRDLRILETTSYRPLLGELKERILAHDFNRELMLAERAATIEPRNVFTAVCKICEYEDLNDGP